MSSKPKESRENTSNNAEKDVKVASDPRPANPARPSKFAGLNLRQRSPDQPPDSAPEERVGTSQAPEAQAPQLPLVTQVPQTTAPADSAVYSDAGRPTPESATPSSAATLREQQHEGIAALSPYAAPPTWTSSSEQRGEHHAEHEASRQLRDIEAPQYLNHSRTSNPAQELQPVQGSRVRRRGKRTDPEFVQVTAYVRQETYRRARIKLLESTKPQEFSEVVEDLLTKWLRSGAK